MTKELRPCPFCGGTDAAIVMTKRVFDNALGYLVMCADCGGAVGLNVDTEFTAFTDFGTEAEAVAAWNTRAARTCHRKAESQAYICSKCCCPLPEWRRDNYCPNCGARVVDE